MRGRDAYRVLGISPGASPEEVRAAFREKVRQMHPDTSSEHGAGSEVQEIVEAYRLLTGSQAGGEGKPPPQEGRGRRVRVRRGASGDVSEGEGAVTCGTCRGSGIETGDVPCPECDGRAVITALDGPRARIVRCRRCAGRGRVGASRRCADCGGSGTVGV